MMTTRRAQAALEYLVTYGWGFILILLIVGALAYYGLLSPSRYISERCSFGAQLECRDYKLSGNGNITLIFRNNYGDHINITRIFVNQEATPATVSVAVPVQTRTLRKGVYNESLKYEIKANDVTFLLGIRGDRVNVPLIVEFRRNIPDAPLHNVTGEIYATVR